MLPHLALAPQGTEGGRGCACVCVGGGGGGGECQCVGEYHNTAPPTTKARPQTNIGLGTK